MEFVFDTETTGIPTKTTYRYPPYTKIEAYNSARIVSISWIIIQRQRVVKQAYFVIKPDKFQIPEDAIKVHGITNEIAEKEGISIKELFDILKDALTNCINLVAHNIDFDYHVLMSELHRYKQKNLIETLSKMHKICTMKKGREVMQCRTYPKLEALYRHLYNEELENAHNAQYDTLYCYKCYIKMFPLDQSLFFFGDKAVRLTSSQQNIVYEDFTKNILVIACAGSGKCHAKDTPIMLYDGQVKLVQDIVPGDLLMGPDSLPRKVLELGSGKGQLYDIIYDKYNTFTVNLEHILCLYFTGSIVVPTRDKYMVRVYDNISKNVIFKEFGTKEDAIMFYNHTSMEVDISVADYLSLSDNIQKEFKLYRPANVIFRNNTQLENAVDYINNQYVNALHLDHSYKIASLKDRKIMIEHLIAKYGKDESIKGWLYIPLTVNNILNNDILFIARSCGFKGTIKKRYIRLKHINSNYSSFKVIPTNRYEKYYGFAVDCDHKYLLGDFIVSHNTTTVICRIKNLIESGIDEESILLTTFTRDAAYDMKTKLYEIMGYKPKITVGTIDSISKMYSERFTPENKNMLKDVSEYSHNFLTVLEKDINIIAKFKYMFIDEFQDINDVQYRIIRKFHENGAKIFVVGDDAQNIYSFRGSKIDYILNFDKLFDNTSTKILVDNFRSTREIINLANACIEKNLNLMPKKMAPQEDFIGNKPFVRYFKTPAFQNTSILEHIIEFIKNGVSEHNIAVLSPVNSSLYMIEELLTKNAIRNVYLDGKCDVKTAKKTHHVCLTTIHKAKGLEWDVVFVIGMSDELIPKNKSSVNIEESRRLFYVAITRAKRELFLYFTPTITPFVTRYISELDRNLYVIGEGTPKGCFEGLSENDSNILELSVTKLIENLDGDDFVKLKENGVIPAIDVTKLTKIELYESGGYQYSKIIEANDLYSDFGIFIEKLIKKYLCSALNIPNCTDKHTLQCLSNVKLDKQDYEIYQMYRNNIYKSYDALEPYMSNFKQNVIKISQIILSYPGKKILSSHLEKLINILYCINERSKKYNLKLKEVPVFSRSFLPDKFESSMMVNLNNYSEINQEDTAEKIRSTWEISKCKKIVTEYRRRLLYKNINMDQFVSSNKDLINSIRDILIPFIVDNITNKNNIICMEEHLEGPFDIYGELDLRIDDIILDYKTSINDELKMQWVIQLLCYKVLCDHNNKKINKIAILNPLRGIYIEYDVRDWNKHDELVKYLLGKRESLLKRSLPAFESNI